MKRRWLAIGVALVLMVAASAAAIAHHAPGHQDSDDVTLEPGQAIEVECETNLSLQEHDGSWSLHCEDVPEPTPEPEPDPTTPPEGDGVIVSDYNFTAGQEDAFVYIEQGFQDGLQQDAPHGVRTIVDSGPYEGWDVLLTDQGWDVRELATDHWITLQLTREATVAIVWQADQPVPAWLEDWEYVGDPVVIEDPQSPKPRQVYEREFGAGEVVLGGVYSEGESGDERSPYVVLLDGADSAPPEDDDAHDDDGHSDDEHHDDGQSDDGHHDDDHTGPDPGDGEFVDDVDEWLYGTHHWDVEPLSVVNTDELEQPVEGEECPAWLSRAHVSQAPDGDYYLTWRPVVDEQYGCYFSYEHGSNPERVPGAYSPPFGYGEPGHIRESEYGYKVKALDNQDGTMVLATTHFGTAEPHKAVCQRFHWNNFQFVQHGELVADIYIMGDFGSARKNDTDEPLDPDNLHQCENIRTGEIQSQAEIQQESFGVRLNPTCTGPANSDCGPFYYPWRLTSPNASQVMGFYSMAYTVNTPTVVAACENMDCLEARFIGGTGAWAFASFDEGFGIRDVGAGGDDGVFYTNPYGDELREGHEDDAVRQFVKPGTDIRLPNISDQTSWFPDIRHGDGKRGDYTYTQLFNGDPNIIDNVDSMVDPEGYIGPFN